MFYLRAARRLPPRAAYHVSTQNLSFLPLRPLVVSCLDLIHMVAPDHWREGAVSRVLYSGLRRARHVLAISEYTKKDLVETLRLPPDRVTVTPLGIDHGVFHPRAPRRLLDAHGLRQGGRYILHVSSEVPRKNFDSVLRAFALLKREPRFSDLLLVKAGSAHRARDRARSRALAEGLGVADSVRFLDKTPEDVLASLYASAAVFAFPSSYEGFGFPPLEAMACGVPVVASGVTSLPEVTGNAALTVAPRDHKALAAAVANILDDASLRDDLVARGLARAAKFTWARTVKGTVEAYATAGLLR